MQRCVLTLIAVAALLPVAHTEAADGPMTKSELMLLIDLNVDGDTVVQAVQSRCVSLDSLTPDEAARLSQYDPRILAEITKCQEDRGLVGPSGGSVEPEPAPAQPTSPTTPEGTRTGKWSILVCTWPNPTEWVQDHASLKWSPQGGWYTGTIEITDDLVIIDTPGLIFPKIAPQHHVMRKEDIIETTVQGLRSRGVCITVVKYRADDGSEKFVSFSGKQVFPAEWLGPGVKTECERSIALHSLLIGKAIEARFEEAPLGAEYQEAVARGYWRDPATGLTWTVADNGKDKRLSQAESYCGKLSLGGFSDWRLPTIAELEALSAPSNRRNVSNQYYDHTVGIKSPIRLTSWGRIWSSDISQPGSAFKQKGWMYDFRENKRDENGTIQHAQMNVLCVR